MRKFILGLMTISTVFALLIGIYDPDDCVPELDALDE